MAHSLLFARLEVGCTWREEGFEPRSLLFAPHSPGFERLERRGMMLEEERTARELRGMRLEEVFAPHSPDVERREGEGMTFEEVCKRRGREGMRLEAGLA